jgi:hypothetical protein
MRHCVLYVVSFYFFFPLLHTFLLSTLLEFVPPFLSFITKQSFSRSPRPINSLKDLLPIFLSLSQFFPPQLTLLR